MNKLAVSRQTEVLETGCRKVSHRKARRFLLLFFIYISFFLPYPEIQLTKRHIIIHADSYLKILNRHNPDLWPRME